MRIGLGSPTRQGVPTPNKPRNAGNIGGVKSASSGSTKEGKFHKGMTVPAGDGAKGGADPMQQASAPQKNFGKTGTGDPTGSYGSNANVHQGKFHK